MKKKQNDDMVAGRLGGVSGRKGKGSRHPAPKPENYGKDRLGITSDAETDPPKATAPPGPRRAPALSRPPATVEAKPAAPKVRIEPEPSSPPPSPPRRLMAKQAPAVQTATPGAFVSSTFKAEEPLWRRYSWAIPAAGTLVALLVVGVIWLAMGDDDEAGIPRTAVAVQPPAAPPTTPRPPRKPRPGGTRREAPWPTRPRPRPTVVTPATSRPADPNAGVKTVSGRAASLMNWARRLRNSHTPRPRPARTTPNQDANTPSTPKPTWRHVPCPSGFYFTGVVHRGSETLANVNGKFVTVGDSIGGAKVIGIGAMSVEMQMDDMRFRVAFGAPPQEGDEDDEPDDEDEADPEDDERAEDDDDGPDESDTPPPGWKPKSKKSRRSRRPQEPGEGE